MSWHYNIQTNNTYKISSKKFFYIFLEPLNLHSIVSSFPKNPTHIKCTKSRIHVNLIRLQLCGTTSCFCWWQLWCQGTAKHVNRPNLRDDQNLFHGQLSAEPAVIWPCSTVSTAGPISWLNLIDSERRLRRFIKAITSFLCSCSWRTIDFSFRGNQPQ